MKEKPQFEFVLKCFNLYLQGPGWEYETELPEWSKVEWVECDIE